MKGMVDGRMGGRTDGGDLRADVGVQFEDFAQHKRRSEGQKGENGNDMLSIMYEQRDGQDGRMD